MNTIGRYTDLITKKQHGALSGKTVNSHKAGGDVSSDRSHRKKGAGTMYDNNYSTKNSGSQDTGLNQGMPQNEDTVKNHNMTQDQSTTQNQTAYSRTAQNPGASSGYQSRYGGYGSGNYSGSTYGDGSYGHNEAQSPYGSQQTGYYRSAGSTGSASNNASNASYGSGSYQYGNTYPNYTAMDQGKHKDKKRKEKKPHQNGYLKKAAICLSRLPTIFHVF